MRRLMLGTLLALSVPTLTQAAPICVSASLADYIALGSGGCMVGDAVFRGFSASGVLEGSTPIPTSSVGVSPVMGATSVGLDFLFDATVGTGELEDVLIRYMLTSEALVLSFLTNTLSMSGSSVTPDGVVFATEEKCADGTFGGSDPAALCSGSLIDDLVVIDTGEFSDLMESIPVFGAKSFDVFTGVVLDGGLEPDGSASLGTVRNEFGFAPTQVVPEPASVLLVGSGLVALARRRRRR